MPLLYGKIQLGEWSRSGIILFDGAMGTELLRQTHYQLPCEQLNLTRPELVEEVHRAYLEAGVDIIRTNSFGANRLNLESYALRERVAEINHAAVAIARRAVESTCPNRQILVAGSIGPIHSAPGDKLRPVEMIYQTYREHTEALVTAGVEMIFGETFQNIDDVGQFLAAALPVVERARPRVAVGVSITPPDISERAAVLAAEFCELISSYSGIALFGCNCGYGPSSMAAPVAVMREQTALPIAVLPSAGLPISEGTACRYPCGSEEFASSLMNLIEHQLVQAVGGCCGTNPEYIAALALSAASYRAN